MAGFDWKNQRGSDGTVFVRALRSLGTVNLPRILPDIESGIADQIGHALKASGHNDGKKMRNVVNQCSWSKGHRSVPVFEMVKSVVTRAGCIAFFGPESGRTQSLYHCYWTDLFPAQNKALLEAAAEVADEVFIGAEFFRLFPESIAG